MTPDTTALRARLRDDCALCGHNHQPYVEVPREDFIALCDAADEVERLRANGNGYLQRAHAAEAVVERLRCVHCGEVGCDWIGDIRKARAEMAEAERDAARDEVERLRAAVVERDTRLAETIRYHDARVNRADEATDASRTAHAALVAGIETGLRESACAECDHDRCATYRSAASWVRDYAALDHHAPTLTTTED